MQLSDLLKSIKLDCELTSVSFSKKKNALTLYIKSDNESIGFSQLSDAENAVKAELSVSEVKIILERQEQSRTDLPVVAITEPPPVVHAENVVTVTEPVPAASVSRTAEDVVKQEGDVLLGKRICGVPSKMESLSGEGEVIVAGEVFDKDTRKLKNGKSVTLISFTDKTSSAIIKFFVSSKQKEAAEKEISKGTSILVHGAYGYDDFEKCSIIEPVSIMRVVPEVKTDDYDGSKRIELHLHTKMSDMDATNKPSEYISLAHKWGHRAVAITDHGNVQAYPEAMNTYEKIMKDNPDDDFKVIYGVEAYFVNDGKPLISEGGRFPFYGKQSEFVVFDTETTGLSPADNRIIEIGAVKIRNMEIVEEFSTFINPEMPIPEAASAVNNITDDMVRNAPLEKEAFEKFLSFCGGSKACLVAHNAPFDMGFIRSGFSRCGLDCDFAVVDTLTLSRAAVPEKRSHKLSKMVEHYKLGDFNAHRALDDAKVTALLFMKIISEANKGLSKRLERVSDLNGALGGLDIKKAKYFHMIILVQNKIGLKNLYKLISYSNLYYFSKKPRIPLSELLRHREGLLIGSACEQGELFQAVVAGKSAKDLEEIAGLYDFLEVQPIGNNAFLVRKGEVGSDVHLQAFNKKIYDLGKKLNKPVVATGDVHFMSEDDSIFREILQTGQGYKDADNQAPLYFRTTLEMLSEFDYLGEQAAHEVVIDNPNKIADLVEQVRPIPKGEFRPHIDGADEEFEQLCRSRAEELYGEPLHEIVQKSIDKELTAIIKHGFSVLYLIAQKLVKKSEDDGYLVGSRGSVGSSLAAYLSGISEVNPLPPHYRCPKCRFTEFDGSVGSGFDLPEKACPECGTDFARDGHDIPFETFLGFDGDKAPDIDLNFSGEYQAQAHKYTEELFGKEYVFKAGTISEIKDKTAFGFVKKFGEGRGIEFNKAEVNRLVAGCVGVKRTTSQHPGGMVVVPSNCEVYDFTPIQHPADKTEEEQITTHFSFKALDETITKLDVLGHDVPTLYKHLGDMTGLDIKEVPTSDKQVMKLFTSTEPLGFSDPLFRTGTYGLPEMGTPFVIQMLTEAKPQTFSDLLQISGLSHGTDVWLGNAKDLIASGKLDISQVIGTRDNIMVYLMQKGMEPKLAFKITEITRKGGASKFFNDEIYEAFEKHEVPDWYVESCKKIKYMFPKAHAAAYVTGAVKLGWFKVYHPIEFYAAALMRHTENIDSLAVVKGKGEVKKRLNAIAAIPEKEKTPKERGTYDALLMVYEAQLRGIEILPAFCEASHPTRYIREENGLRLPYAAIEGCGETAARKLYEVVKSGDFICIDDIQSKAGLNKNVLESLNQTRFFGKLPQSAQISLFEL
jgi:DNA polymerase-3 subunit alpha (Gram-positive type)